MSSAHLPHCVLKSATALACLLLVAGCASHRPAPEPPLDQAVKAHPLPETVRPLQIVEIPQPLPLPGQLKPLLTLPGPATLEAPDGRGQQGEAAVNQANAAARMEPSKPGFLNSVQVWPYSPGALYQVYTSPGRVTDVALQPGEELRDISAPDTVRWVIGDTESGDGANRIIHIAVKPTRAGLQSNLAIYTSRRTYFLELTSTAETWMASVSWDYPQDRLLALKTANRQRETAQPVQENVPLDRLQFRYAISGDSPPWRPERAFDDGERVYIEFPAAIAQGEMPPLFVIGTNGEADLVNYRVRPPYYVVDRLFGAAELRLGGEKAAVVRIARTDLVTPDTHRSRSR